MRLIFVFSDFGLNTYIHAEGHDEGPQDETSDPPLTTEGGPITRSRTRAKNRHML